MKLNVPLEVTPKEAIALLLRQNPKLPDEDLFKSFPSATIVGADPHTAVIYDSWDGSKLEVSTSDAHNWGHVEQAKRA